MAEDLNRGVGATTIPTDSGGTRAATMMGIQTFLGDAVLNPADMDGSDLGEKINAAIAELDATYGGTLDLRGTFGPQTISTAITIDRPLCFLWGPGNYTFDAAPVFSAGHRVQWLGLGTTITTFTSNAAGVLFDINSVIHECCFADFLAQINTSGGGFLRVGRTSDDYNGDNFRQRWDLHNLYILGPGEANSGSIGISVTQLINHCITNITIQNFESSAIIDRCGNGTWTRPRFQAYTNGPLISIKAGTGTEADGSSQDVFINPEFLGPTAGTGDTVTVQTKNITFINALYEPQTGGTSNSFIHLASRGALFADSAYFRDIEGLFSGVVLPTNTIVLDTGYLSPTFDGTEIPIAGYPAVSFGTPYAFAESSAKFIDVSARLTDLVIAADPDGAKAFIDAPSLLQSGFNAYRRQTELMDQTGTFRIVGTATDAIPDSGSGIEMFYQLGGDQAIITCASRSGGVATYKPCLFQASSVEFNHSDVVLDKRIYSTTVTTITGATPSAAASNFLRTNNSGSTTITNIADGISSQVVTIVFGDAHTTVQNNGNIELSGSADFVGTLFSSLTLMRDSATGLWIEIGRSLH